MPDPKHSTRPSVDNAFDPNFLEDLEHRDISNTTFEAVHGGFWTVVPLDDERFGLFRPWEHPEQGDEPFAVITDRCTAVLAATFLPLLAATRTLWLIPADDGEGFRLRREGREVGQMRRQIPELTDALNPADALVRTPTSLASVLQAAGPGGGWPKPARSWSARYSHGLIRLVVLCGVSRRGPPGGSAIRRSQRQGRCRR